MPGQPPPDGPDDRTVLYALPEDQPDSLSEGETSNQADLDVTPAEKEAATDGLQNDENDVPAKSSTKVEWEAYAATQGVDTDGMTKDEIINAVS